MVNSQCKKRLFRVDHAYFGVIYYIVYSLFALKLTISFGQKAIRTDGCKS